MEADLQTFLRERPAINHSAFARQLNFDRVDFAKIAAGLKKIPKGRRGDFLNLMRHYGWPQNGNDAQTDNHRTRTVPADAGRGDVCG